MLKLGGLPSSSVLGFGVMVVRDVIDDTAGTVGGGIAVVVRMPRVKKR